MPKRRQKAIPQKTPTLWRVIRKDGVILIRGLKQRDAKDAATDLRRNNVGMTYLVVKDHGPVINMRRESMTREGGSSATMPND